MDTRAFPGGSAKVARLVRASVRGYDGTGVAPTLKHFPGLGATSGNTDKVQVTITQSRAAIEARTFRRFGRGRRRGARRHAFPRAVPGARPRRIASQSQPIVDGTAARPARLRGRHHDRQPGGVSVRARSSIETAAIRSMRAGVDLILMTGAGSHIRIQRAFRPRPSASATFRARLERAGARVRTLQGSLHRG